MKPIVILCKSFDRDAGRAKILFESIKKHNKEKIPFYLSVPSADIALFKNTLGTEDNTLVADEDVLGKTIEQSWVTQQIIKSSFWKLGLCQNYLMVDSDSYFIRDFGVADFLVDVEQAIPYTVMHEQKDLFAWTAKNHTILGFDPQISYAKDRKPIMELFDRKGRLYDFGPGPVIWSAAVWRSLEEKYIKPNNLTFEDLVRAVSGEFGWYGEWLLTDKTIPLWPIEPIFKFFYYRQIYEEAKQRGFTEEHWAKNYLGVVMQSSAGCPTRY